MAALKPKFVLAAGGSGGHIFPAVALAERLQSDYNAEVIFVGVGGELERRIVAEAGFRHEVVEFSPVVGKGLTGILRALRRVPQALSQARQLLLRERVDAVIGFGGFPSFMPLVAARTLGINCYLQEQNVQAGMANKIASLLVKRVYSVPKSVGLWCNHNRIRTITNPVRRFIFDVSHEAFKDVNGKDISSKVAADIVEESGVPSVARQDVALNLLVLGGSQGAHALNEAILGMKDELRKAGIKVVHQLGEVDFSAYLKQGGVADDGWYRALPFVKDMRKLYDEAHLVVCRAGAMTVSEIVATRRPAIFVPLPIARGHQADNVADLLRYGIARVVKQEAGFAGQLLAQILEFNGERKQLVEMHQGLARYAERFGKDGADVMARELLADLSYKIQ